MSSIPAMVATVIASKSESTDGAVIMLSWFGLLFLMGLACSLVIEGIRAVAHIIKYFYRKYKERKKI